MASCNVLRLFDFGVICYEIRNGRHFHIWLASWGGVARFPVSYVTERRGGFLSDGLRDYGRDL